jgi:hypothetical protein
MVAPVLPPDVPIIGSSKVQPSWWRWFREVNAGLNDVTDLIAASQATVLPDVALTAGENTIAHGLGATPSTWWAARPRGAFNKRLRPVPGLSGSYWDTASAGNTSFSFSMVDPSASSKIVSDMSLMKDTIIMIIGGFCGSPVDNIMFVNSISQDGVSWSKVGRVGPDALLNSNDNAAIELWVGNLTGIPSENCSFSYVQSLSDFNVRVAWASFSGLTGAVRESSLGFARIPDGDVICSENFTSDFFTLPLVFNYQAPVPHVNDFMITAFGSAGIDSYVIDSNGWSVESSSFRYNTRPPVTLYSKSAYEEDNSQFSFKGSIFRYDDIYDYYMIQACFPVDESTASVESVIPSGIREISLNDTNLVVDSLSDVTVDFLFR